MLDLLSHTESFGYLEYEGTSQMFNSHVKILSIKQQYVEKISYVMQDNCPKIK